MRKQVSNSPRKREKREAISSQELSKEMVKHTESILSEEKSYPHSTVVNLLAHKMPSSFRSPSPFCLSSLYCFNVRPWLAVDLLPSWDFRRNIENNELRF